MQQWPEILIASATVFTIVGIGFFARRAQWLNEQADAALLKLVIWVLLPCLILHIIANNEHMREARNVIMPPLVGSGTVLAGFALGALVAWRFGRFIGLQSPAQRRTFALCVGMYNFGYIPIPIIQALFGPRTLGVLFVHNMAIEITMWTVGVAMLTGHVGSAWWKRVLTPPSVAIVFALLLNISGASQYAIDVAPHLAGFFATLTNMLGQTAIPLGLILIGGTIAEQLAASKVRLEPRVVASGALLRLAILPAMFLLLAYALPDSLQELRRVVVVQAAMPSAIFPIVLAKHYGGDPATALRITLGTSVIGLVTMPLWLPIGLSLIR